MLSQLHIRPASRTVVSQLQAELGLPRFIAQTLVARSIDTPEKAEYFFNPSLERDWLNPYLIPGLSEVVDALEAAIRHHKRIVVYGDFDVDGISATALMTRGLRALGAHDVTPFIPRRFEEGYAITPASIERLLTIEPDVVVTVDCGISCKHEASLLQDLGVEMLITDHHEPSEFVPQGMPVCDPKLDPNNASAILAGAGVALKVIQALGARFARPHVWRDYTDLACLGTVADLMPMRDENRALVADGLEKINTQMRPCLAALLAETKAQNKRLDATDLSFSIIPRLNAAGRMGDAALALDLLLADDFEEASQCAAKLEAVNTRRREVEAELSIDAQKKAEEIYQGERVLVVAGDDWHEGVKGIVASRLVTTYGVPCLLFTIDGDEARGSGRTSGDINLFKAVESCSDLLLRFGGHEAAVGVSLSREKLPEFARRLNDYMAGLPAESFRRTLHIDAVLDLQEASVEHIALLDKLAPFGQEHPVPQFLVQSANLVYPRAVGADKNHLISTLSDGLHELSSVMFRCPNMEEMLGCTRLMDVVCTLQVDEWCGRKTAKAMVKEFLPASLRDEWGDTLTLPDSSPAEGAYSIALNQTELQAEKLDIASTDSSSEQACEDARSERFDRWSALVRAHPDQARDRILAELIGTAQLHASQAQALDILAEQHSLLALMGTGRGKSLLFHVHALMRAFLAGEQSIYVYPLRALITDQYRYLSEALTPFGIRAVCLTGEVSRAERARSLADLAQGRAHIVLTTPEYVSLHAQELASNMKTGFIALDEAHHIARSSIQGRPAYADLPRVLDIFKQPCVLATTATANTEQARRICDDLGIEQTLVDDHKRENLRVCDVRDMPPAKRLGYMAHLVAQANKTLIYVATRQDAVELAQQLRHKLPHQALAIGFYHAELTADLRHQLEDYFRRGVLRVLVCTSAFGEGVNLPDIDNVVLAGMPLSALDLNQISGRAGRDGRIARIHYVFGQDDIKRNRILLESQSPERDLMALLYRGFKHLQEEHAGESFELSVDELEQFISTWPRALALEPAARCAAEVFDELGLLDLVKVYDGRQETYHIRLNDQAEKVDLCDSVRYREGQLEKDCFENFALWLNQQDASSLRSQIISPIIPTSENKEA